MQYAIGAFNTYNLEVTQAIIRAAEEQRSAVIIQTSEGAIEYAGLAEISAIVSSLAKHSSVPVVLHLDHGKSVKQALACIESGYTSVMIDASSETYAKNVAMTKEVVVLAHARGVWVEAELGAILGIEGALALGNTVTPETMMTKPKQAQEFVAKTGIDSLAVSVGTIHGAFTGQEYIRFELVRQIQEALPDFPLVIHGASGIAADNLQEIATTNVCKINIDTEVRIAFEGAVKQYFREEHKHVDPRKFLSLGRTAAQATVAEKMQLFGSSGRIKL